MNFRDSTIALAVCLATAALFLPAVAPAHAGAASFTAFGAGQVTNPLGVAVDQKGFVYVADSGGSRIQKFDNAGGLVATILPISGGTALSVPTGVAVDNPKVKTDDPNIYVADQNGHVQKLAPDGTFLLDFGAFSDPIGVDVDDAGHVLVTDAGASKDIVAKFAPDGTLLNVYGKPGGGPGSGPGQFDNPQDIATDPSGDMYIADGNNNRVQRLDPTGAFVFQISPLSDPAGIDHALALVGITLQDRLWITARGSDQFFEYDLSGNLLDTEGGSGIAVGQFNGPYGLAVDCDGNVFISDSVNDRIQRFGGANTPPCTPPDNTRSPEIAGQATVGSGLALDPGDWTGSPTPRIVYRWQRCSTDNAASCGDIAGERGLTYTVTNADRGFRIRTVVIGANVDGVIPEATDMTPQIPTVPITPLPPAPPPNPPVPLGGGGGSSQPTVTQTGLATFTVNCPPTGARTCSVSGDLVGRSKKNQVTLASVEGEVPFNKSQGFTLLLTKRGRSLLRGGLHRATLSVTVDGQQLLTANVRVNRSSIKQFGSGG